MVLLLALLVASCDRTELQPQRQSAERLAQAYAAAMAAERSRAPALVLAAQDTVAIVKLARGLALPGGSLRVGKITARGTAAVADVHVFAQTGAISDQTLHRLHAVRRADGRWVFQALEPVSAATASREPYSWEKSEKQPARKLPTHH